MALKISLNKNAADHLPVNSKTKEEKDRKKETNRNLNALDIFFIKK